MTNDNNVLPFARPVYVVADLIVNISAPVEGEFKDWPRELQDRTMKEMEMRGIAAGRKYELVRAYCGESDGVPFIHVVCRARVTLQ